MKRIDGDSELIYLNSMDELLTNITSTDQLYIHTVPFAYKIATGSLEQYTSVNNFGYLANINTADPPVVVSGFKSSSFTGFPTSYETCQILSTSADDSATGIGARTVLVNGLDSNLLEVEETVSLNGTSPVTLLNVYSRVNRMIVMTGGSTGENLGRIYVRYTPTTAVEFSSIPIGVNQTLSSVYTVPMNKIGFLLRYSFNISRSGGNAGSTTLSFRKRPLGGVFNSFRYETFATGSSDNITLISPQKLESGTDMMLMVEDVSDNNTSISTSYSIIIIDKTLFP